MVLAFVVSLAVNFVLLRKPSDLSVIVPTNNNEEIKSYLQQIIDLGDDDPTIAEVQDSENLKGENPYLYSGVENGDKIFIYENKIVIFRPSTQKILNVMGILEQQQ